MKPASPSAYRLMHEGSLALCKMECVGLPVCREELSRAKDAVTQQIRSTEQQMRSMDEYQRQRKKFGIRTKIGSREQLADILYKDLNYPGMQVNPKTGKIIFDDEVLNEIDTPYTKLFKKVQKFHKLNSTYLTGIERELCGDRVHAVLNTHTVTTYRSSADSPNIQNFPIRDPEIGQILRSIIRPKPGKVIVEIDYSTLEVVIGACLHGDPTMSEYLLTGFDFHRATAQECFFMEDVPKPLRQLAKVANFSLIYGDFFAAIAAKMWKAVDGLTQENSGVGGQKVFAHLNSKGIKRLGNENDTGPDTFTGHIQKVCDRFWGQRFPIFAKWRRDTWEDYARKGYLYTRTGFRVWGVYKRNEILNVETQGCAFHCLLRSVIEITRRLEQSSLKSRLVGQIHDSVLAEVPIEEIDEYVGMATEVMTTWLRSQWSWIKLPLSTETEVGDSWAAKTPYHKHPI